MAEDLVAKMTLEEKCSQVVNWAPAIERLNVKSYNWWNEALHGVARAGVATVFPQAVTLAASFNEELLEEVGDAVSTEGRAKFNNQQKYDDHDIYKGLTFWAPNINIFRDPRWGRGHETFGEDPYLTSRLGTRYIDGIQGKDENNLKAAACAKHYAVHSGPEGIRHSFDAKVNKKDFWETYLYAFEKCIENTHVEAVMGAYNRVNGEPACGSRTLLIDILRNRFGFEGHVTSDCWAIKDFYTGHMVCDTPLEAVALAMNNGCDVNCGDLFKNMKQAVDEGLVKESRLDEALVRLFTTRYKLGIMEGQTSEFDGLTLEDVDSDGMKDLNLRAALESVVLLKNENAFLPLDAKKIKTVGIVGPNADNKRALVGNYEGTASRYETVLLGIEDLVGSDVRVMYSEGCHLFKDKVENLGQPNDRMAEVKGVCENSDVVICCVGLDAGLEGEEGDAGNAYASGDKKDLSLPGLQNELLKAVLDSGKPVIVVLLAGSSIDLRAAKEKAAAIVYAGYPGARGGEAVADIIFGKANPSGKLPFTFYNSVEELPAFTDYSMKDRTYRYMKNDAQFPFGFGLGYSEFEIADEELPGECKEADLDSLEVKLNLRNKGCFDGAQVLQIYVASNEKDAPRYQLKAFKKVFLKAGEKREVIIPLSRDSFEIVNETGEFIVNKGKKYTVYIGFSQPDGESEKLLGIHPTAHDLVII
ncbi:MAG: glycoside hydrolase family 3 C-terminal domain-containing protein [Lachnospiraceae bacterium]|nr:glycoside hydrolase family 3 C-terminal domain-containing protein [Lachnospiraceae bacterium]